MLKKIINVNLSLLTVPLISDWEFKILLLKLLKSTGLFLKKPLCQFWEMVLTCF